MSKKIDIKKDIKRIVQEYLHMVSKTHQEGVFSKYSENYCVDSIIPILYPIVNIIKYIFLNIN